MLIVILTELILQHYCDQTMTEEKHDTILKSVDMLRYNIDKHTKYVLNDLKLLLEGQAIKISNEI